MKKAIFSLLSIVMLIGMALPAASPVVMAADLSYEYWVWDKDTGNWVTPRNIGGYAEGDCIPSYLKVINSGESAENITVHLIFDRKYKDSPREAFVGYECCDNCTQCPATPPDCCTGGGNITSCPVAGNITGPNLWRMHGNYEEWAYNWTFTISGNTTIIQCWCARLGNEAALFPGASAHMEVSTIGGIVSVNPKDLLVPDLYANKTANVICDEISYTINYGNNGTANQTGTVLVDAYDGTKVTVTNITGGGTDNATAGTITWNFGTVPAGASGNVSYTVSIKGGVANGTAIINSGNITGDLAEENTDDNSYNVTSYAKVSPAATAASNSPVCEGETIQLYGGPNGMASYNWTGPVWTNSTQNATRPNATLAMAGNYTLTVTASQRLQQL